MPSRAAAITPASSADARGADADRDDRLAEGDDDDQAVALGEVPGRDPPAARAPKSTAGVVDAPARRARARPAAAPSMMPATMISAGPMIGGRREPKTAPMQLAVAVRRDVRTATMCSEPHDEVGDAEEDAVVAERLRHGSATTSIAAMTREHREPHRALVGVERVRQPGVAGPGPPERAEHEHPRPSPPQVGSRAISAVTCVIAKTKTRSKNSSSGVTRSSRSVRSPRGDANDSAAS